MAKVKGIGVVVEVDVAATPTTVANVEEIDYPDIEQEVDEVTNHGSTNGWREFLATGQKGLMPFDLTLIWDISEATHAEIRTLSTNGTAVTWTVDDPASAEKFTFEAIVSKLVRQPRKDAALRAIVTVQPTGAVTVS